MSIDRLRNLDLRQFKNGAKLESCRRQMIELLTLSKVTDSYCGHIAASFRQFAEYYRGGVIEDEFQRWLAWKAESSQASTMRFLVSSIGARMRDAEVISETKYRIIKRSQPRGSNKTVAMSDEQYERVLSWQGMGSEQQQLQQIVLLRILALTGIRKCEALALKRKHVNLLMKEYRGFAEFALEIRYDVAKQKVPRVAQTWCPLDSHSFSVFNNLLILREDPESDLFQKPDGSRLTARSLQYWLNELKQSSSEQGMSPHAMRHRIAQKVQEMYSEDVAKLVLGHSIKGAIRAYLNMPDIWEPIVRVWHGEEFTERLRAAR